ncbi:MAG: DUF5107 domain-containing protein [Ferruginibacter sp.]
MQPQVSVWIEKINIPTYPVGKPEKNPVFLEKRVYQGSSGAVYPHAIIEKIYDEKTEKEYTAVFIENDYLKIMVLPELGGRIQRAYDKIRQRDFVYYNQVVKPALVGLTGPWISGGIEFNWPQHHRPSTFEPVDFTIEENEDGSKSIWVNEVELMTRTKGMIGFTLYPGHAYLEIKGRVFNRSSLPQTFLWWANPAIKVNQHAQSIFPPDVYAVFDHGKRDVSDFPVATGTYYKVDYSPGTDISLYKNIPVPTSYMAIQSGYNFIGCYENDTQAGMLHIADHHFSPGKKQWTWGTGDFGKAWEKNLTDEDGPYIELMCGVYTDNQPDFTWIQPNEEKSFEQYFLPYAGIGIVKNATREAAISLEITDEKVDLKVYATGKYNGATIRLVIDDKEIFAAISDLSPEEIFEKMTTFSNPVALKTIYAEVLDATGTQLVDYLQEELTSPEIPPAAVAAKQPAEIESVELLFLNGLHLEQYRHATFSPVDFYKEGLRRDPGDTRCNNAMGLWHMRRGNFTEAETYFRTAVSRLVQRNPNPSNGEPYYHLGLCLKLQGENEKAFDAFYKSAWNDACQHSAYFQLALIATGKGDFKQGLYLIEKSLLKSYHSHSARHLKTVLLRKLQNDEAALNYINESLKIDLFNYGCHFEHYLVLKQEGKDLEAGEVLIKLKTLLRHNFNNYIEYTIDYVNAGLFEEAKLLLLEYTKEDDQRLHPLTFYYLGWIALKSGDPGLASAYFIDAAEASPDYCFPSKVEDIAVLQSAIDHDPLDFHPNYFLGNFWYANGQFEKAINCWEQAVAINDTFPTVHRNLSLAYYNKRKEVEKAVASLEKAFDLDRKDARVLMELDQLYKLNNHCHWKRLQLLEEHVDLVEERDDLYLERIVLYNHLGDFETARALLAEHKFHPWEGGEGKVVSQYLLCHIELAKNAFAEGDHAGAIELLKLAKHYPDNLGEGKLPGAPENDIHYFMGIAYAALGDTNNARLMFSTATNGISTPVQAIFYNDPQPDKIFYQGLAWLQLEEQEKASTIFESLIKFGSQHMNDDIRIDYFAVSLPELLVFDQDLNQKNYIHCNYLTGLGNLGLNKTSLAEASFRKVLGADRNHQGAITHLNMIHFINSYGNKKNMVGQL